jgi:hypothetical protein
MKHFHTLSSETLSQITGGAGDAPQPPANPSDIYRVCGSQGADFAMNGNLNVKTPLGLSVSGQATLVKCLPQQPANPPPAK